MELDGDSDAVAEKLAVGDLVLLWVYETRVAEIVTVCVAESEVVDVCDSENDGEGVCDGVPPDRDADSEPEIEADSD